GFRITRRRRGEVLLAFHLAERGLLAHGQLRESAVVVIVAAGGLAVIPPLLVNREEAGELNHLTRGAQAGLAVFRQKLGGGALHPGACHLTGDGALPDEFIQLRLLRREVARRLLRAQAEVGWADGLVGLLRVLGLALVSAGLVRHIGLAEVFRDDRARACNRLAAQRHAVRTHVGDEAGGLAAD